MKLRLRENSIRLRLLQTEVRRLRETGSVAEQITFGINPGENLIYALVVSADASDITAQISNGRIEITLPVQTAENWAETNLTGLYGEQKISDTVRLKIIVEKDFVCGERPGDADNNDACPHPKTIC